MLKILALEQKSIKLGATYIKNFGLFQLILSKGTTNVFFMLVTTERKDEDRDIKAILWFYTQYF